MKATNLTLQPVLLDPVNGPGMLAAAVDGETEHVRELVEVTDRERALAEGGVILLEGEPPSDKYDRMDRKRLEADAKRREVPVTREDGRSDLEPTEDEYRRALRLADANGGE